MEVLLNGQRYWTTTPIRSDKYVQWPEQLRTTGQQLRADRAPFPLWAPDNISGGIGRKRYKSGEPTFHFATCDTIWGQITLPLIVKSTSIDDYSTSAVFKAFVDSKGSTYALLLDSAKAYTAVWDATNKHWDAAGTVLATNCDGAYALVEHEGDLYAVIDNNGTLSTYKSSDAAVTWAANNDTGLTGLGPAVLVDARADMYIATWTAATSKIIVWKSTDDAANWTTICTFYSQEGPKGIVMFQQDDTGGTQDLRPFVRTYEGTWQCDATANKVVKVVEAGPVGDVTTYQGLAIWQEVLAIPDGKDMVLRTTSGVNTPMGPTSMDGFPTAYLGHITALVGARYHLLAAIAGTTYSGIYRYDGVGWHALHVEDHADTISVMHASGASGVPTLFYSHGAGDHWYIENYHDNPAEISTVEYAPSGTFTYPIFGRDMGETQGVYYSLRIYGIGLTDGGEEVDIHYDVDEEGSFRYLGTFNKDVEVLRFPDGGVIADALQLRLTLHRGATATVTPIVKYIALEFQQSLDTLTVNSFTVDVAETETRYQRVDVLSEIREMQTTKSLITFQHERLEEPITTFGETVSLTYGEVITVEFRLVED